MEHNDFVAVSGGGKKSKVSSIELFLCLVILIILIFLASRR